MTSWKILLIGIIVIIVFSVASISLILYPRKPETEQLARTKVYGETATIERKEWGYVTTGFNQFREQYIVILSTGTRYEIESKTDWNQIQVNDEVKQYHWSYEGFIKDVGFPCWLEVLEMEHL